MLEYLLLTRMFWSTFTLLHSGQEHILSQSRSQYIKAKVNTTHYTKKAEEIHHAVRKSRKLLANKEQELAEGRQEKAELERTWKNYEKQVQAEGTAGGRDIELDKDQVRFHTI